MAQADIVVQADISDSREQEDRHRGTSGRHLTLMNRKTEIVSQADISDPREQEDRHRGTSRHL